jgi:hypothetical protein
VSRSEDDSSPYFQPSDGVTALHQYAEVGAKTKEMLGKYKYICGNLRTNINCTYVRQPCM